MQFIRFSVLAIVAATLAGCSLSPRQWQTISAITTERCEPPEQSHRLDLLRLTILEVDSLPPGCVTQVIYRYGRRDAWSYMLPDEQNPNRFLGGVMSNVLMPVFLIGSKCEGGRYYEYRGRIELWRQSIGHPWIQLMPAPAGENN